MTLFTNLQSDIYKVIHMPFWLIHIIAPIVGILLLLGYYMISPWEEIEKLSAYIEILSVVFPVLIGIITAILVEMEQKAGEFQLMLTVSKPKVISHISKIIVILCSGLFSTILGVVGFGIGFRFMGYETVSLFSFFKISIILWISVLPVYLLYYIVSFYFGKGFGIGLGIIGGLLSALLMTGLGDGIWWFIPWGITSRLSECYLLATLSYMKFIELDGIKASFVFMTLFILICIVFLIFIFNKWEGRKSED